MNILKLLNKKEKVLVVGESILDRYVYGNSERISSEVPIPVFKSEENTYKLGGAANVAKNISNFGVGVGILTVLNHGVTNGVIKNLLKKNKVDLENVIDDGNYHTPVKTRYFDGLYQCFREDHEKTNLMDLNLIDKIISKFRTNFKKYKLIVISDYNNGLLNHSVVRYIIENANKNNIKVLVDPKRNDYNKFKDSFLIKPNKKDAEYFCKFIIETDLDILKASKHFCHQLNTNICMITLSDRGISIYNRDTDVHQIFETDEKLDVIDVTGAGDTVISTVCLGLINNLNYSEMCKLSNKFAANVITKQGTQVVDLLHFIRNNKLIENLEQLRILAWILKKKNKKIVFTTGCFDIVHLGHIQSLKKAKQKGDILIVALNSDLSIKKIKGEQRPVQNLKTRLAVLQELSCVDFVITFDDNTPVNIHNILNPNFLVKGGDYTYQQIKKIYPKLNNYVQIDIEEGYSTTNIINLIKNS